MAKKVGNTVPALRYNRKRQLKYNIQGTKRKVFLRSLHGVREGEVRVDREKE